MNILYLRREMTTFDGALQVARRRLLALTSAVGTCNYHEAWFCAVLFNEALTHAIKLAALMPATFHRDTVDRLASIQSIAAPLLALAPRPTRQDLRGRWGPRIAELRWRRQVLHEITSAS